MAKKGVLDYMHVLVVYWVRIVGTFFIRGCKGRSDVNGGLLISVVFCHEFVAQTFRKKRTYFVKNKNSRKREFKYTGFILTSLYVMLLNNGRPVHFHNPHFLCLKLKLRRSFQKQICFARYIYALFLAFSYRAGKIALNAFCSVQCIFYGYSGGINIDTT